MDWKEGVEIMRTGLKRVDVARENLTEWMVKKAEETRLGAGFGWVEKEVAPSTLEEVKQAHRASQVTGCPFPVWSGGSERTVFTRREGNYSFRFVHDLIHAREGYEFTLAGEMEAAQELNEEIGRVFGKESLEYRIAVADSMGQTLYAETHGGSFPEDQLGFVLSMLGEY